MATDIELTREALRTPRAAGLAGVLFALLFGAVIVLARSSVPADPDDAGAWLTDEDRRHSVTLALNLLPFAGIAFLWFMGAVRSRIGQYEDRFFATVYLGSGLLFVAMLFVLGGVAASLSVTQAELASDAGLEQWRFGRRITYHLMTTYAMRMAAVFTIATSTVVLRVAVLHRWLAFVGFAVGIVLLFAGPSYSWVALAFPIWVLLVSVTLLVSSFQSNAVTA
jgi:hypothetical protein